MGEDKQIEIKNRTYYFCNDMINLKNFKSNLLKLDKKSYKNIGIYNVGYITIKKTDDYESIYSINLLHLQVNHANGCIKEKNGNKYLVFDTADESKKLQKKYKNFWNGIKSKMEEKYSIKIKFNSDDDLPLNKATKISCDEYNYQICF